MSSAIKNAVDPGVAPPAPDGVEPYWSQASSKWAYEHPEGGEREWDDQLKQWIEIADEEAIKRQQAAYSVAGVDEDAPALDPREQRKSKKRKREDGPQKKEARNTAIFVSNLPDDPPPDADELAQTFNRAGLILEGTDGKPKVKLYDGENQGKALVVYLKEESIDLAITLFDGAPLRIGGSGSLKVEKASFGHKGETDGNAEATADANAAGPSRRARSDPNRANQGRKADKLRSKLENWSSEDEDAKPAPGANSKIVVLAHMFTLKELEDDPALLLDLKEDVREECETTCGKVTSVQLYDLEPDGVMTVKFSDPVSAKACVLKMNGRFFGGQAVIAGLYDGKHRYRKSGRGSAREDDAQNEAERIEEFGRWLEAS